MSPDALRVLRARIERTLLAAKRQASEGFQQSHTLSDGHEHHYTITGIKSPEQFEDELLTLFMWVWSAKDYLKELYRANNEDPQFVEDVVSGSIALQYVSDIANRAKHGELRKSRSGRFAELVDVGFTVPQSAVSKLSFGAFSVGVDVHKSEEVILEALVKPQGGPALDAFAVLEEALAVWEAEVLQRVAR